MMDHRRREYVHSIGLLILRLGTGAFMASHGWGKVEMVFAGQFDQFGDPIGIGSGASLVLAATAEFLCSVLVMLGLFTRFAAVPVVITMGVAALFVHTWDPWTMGEGARLFMEGKAQTWASKEPALLFLIPFLALVFTGAGQYSIDALIWRRRSATA